MAQGSSTTSGLDGSQSSTANASPQPEQPLSLNEPSSLHGQKPGRVLSYRKRALYLLLFYLPLLTLPWILTCIMMFRPIMKPSYINQVGKYSLRDIWHMERWLVATKIIDGVASVLAVPVVSALLAQGAVVYTQRRKEKGQKELNLEQTFALANKGWSDIPIICSVLDEDTPRKTSPYLWYGVGLILLAAIQPPLKQLLVQDEAKTVVTCNDQPGIVSNKDSTCDTLGFDNKVIGLDSEPSLLAACPRSTVVQRTLNKLIDVRKGDVQPHLWREVKEDENLPVNDQIMSTFRFFYPDWSSSGDPSPGTFFASPVVNGTTTGVLRQHAARMDTDVTCIIDNHFPATCPGDRPFVTDFTSPALNVSVCTEGNYDSVPWMNTRDAQNLTERVWLHIHVDPDSTSETSAWDDLRLLGNYTIRCDSTSRRGWFELGNYQNEFAHQPMLDTWPDDEAMKTQFNDIAGNGGPPDKYWPVKEGPTGDTSAFTYEHTLSPFDTADRPTPGPLMTASLALFGNNTLLHSVRNATNETEGLQAMQNICAHGRIPFYVFRPSHVLIDDILGPRCDRILTEGALGDDFDPTDLSEFVGGFMRMFDPPLAAGQLLEIATFFANEALLSVSAEVGPLDTRSIYTAPGYVLLKPQHSIPGLVVISVVVALQVLSLLLLLRFIYSAPSWTGSLDALALARIGAQLQGQGMDLDSLGMSGMVGIGEREKVVSNGENGMTRRNVKVLGLGESGVISKGSLEETFGCP